MGKQAHIPSQPTCPTCNQEMNNPEPIDSQASNNDNSAGSAVTAVFASGIQVMDTTTVGKQETIISRSKGKKKKHISKGKDNHHPSTKSDSDVANKRKHHISVEDHDHACTNDEHDPSTEEADHTSYNEPHGSAGNDDHASTTTKEHPVISEEPIVKLPPSQLDDHVAYNNVPYGSAKNDDHASTTTEESPVVAGKPISKLPPPLSFARLAARSSSGQVIDIKPSPPRKIIKTPELPKTILVTCPSASLVSDARPRLLYGKLIEINVLCKGKNNVFPAYPSGIIEKVFWNVHERAYYRSDEGQLDIREQNIDLDAFKTILDWVLKLAKQTSGHRAGLTVSLESFDNALNYYRTFLFLGLYNSAAILESPIRQMMKSAPMTLPQIASFLYCVPYRHAIFDHFIEQTTNFHHADKLPNATPIADFILGRHPTIFRRMLELEVARGIPRARQDLIDLEDELSSKSATAPEERAKRIEERERYERWKESNGIVSQVELA